MGEVRNAWGSSVSFSVTLAVVPAAWLVLAVFFAALCRMAHADHASYAEQAASVEQAAGAIPVPHTIAAGLVVWEEPPNVERELRKLMLRGRGAQPRGAQSAA